MYYGPALQWPRFYTMVFPWMPLSLHQNQTQVEMLAVFSLILEVKSEAMIANVAIAV